jgi:hypothetical protein
MRRRPGLRLPPLTEMAKREVPSDPELLAHSAAAKRAAPLAMLQENSLMAPAKRETAMERLQRDPLAEAMRLLLDVVRPGQVKWRLPADLDLR